MKVYLFLFLSIVISCFDENVVLKSHRDSGLTRKQKAVLFRRINKHLDKGNPQASIPRFIEKEGQILTPDVTEIIQQVIRNRLRTMPNPEERIWLPLPTTLSPTVKPVETTQAIKTNIVYYNYNYNDTEELDVRFFRTEPKTDASELVTTTAMNNFEIRDSIIETGNNEITTTIKETTMSPTSVTTSTTTTTISTTTTSTTTTLTTTISTRMTSTTTTSTTTTKTTTSSTTTTSMATTSTTIIATTTSSVKLKTSITTTTTKPSATTITTKSTTTTTPTTKTTSTIMQASTEASKTIPKTTIKALSHAERSETRTTTAERTIEVLKKDQRSPAAIMLQQTTVPPTTTVSNASRISSSGDSASGTPPVELQNPPKEQQKESHRPKSSKISESIKKSPWMEIFPIFLELRNITQAIYVKAAMENNRSTRAKATQEISFEKLDSFVKFGEALKPSDYVEDEQMENFCNSTIGAEIIEMIKLLTEEKERLVASYGVTLEEFYDKNEVALERTKRDLTAYLAPEEAIYVSSEKNKSVVFTVFAFALVIFL